MKRTLIAAAGFALVAVSGLASAASWSVIVQPGVYGRVAIGGYVEAPRLYSEQPVIAIDDGYGNVEAEYVDPATLSQPPVYLWVPDWQRAQWARYCNEYGAYGVPVVFVDDGWYRDNVLGRRWSAQQRAWSRAQWIEQDRIARERWQQARWQQQQQRQWADQRAQQARWDHDRADHDRAWRAQQDAQRWQHDRDHDRDRDAQLQPQRSAWQPGAQPAWERPQPQPMREQIAPQRDWQPAQQAQQAQQMRRPLPVARDPGQQVAQADRGRQVASASPQRPEQQVGYREARAQEGRHDDDRRPSARMPNGLNDR
jgi:hypothetical protein